MKMDDKLKHLRKSMSKTIFKDFDVNKQELKRNVLNESKKHHPLFNFKQWMRTGMSAISVAILCFIIGIAGFSDQLFENSEQNSKPDYRSAENNDNPENIEEKLKPSEKYPDKFQIVKKKRNSRDYVNSALGVYEYFPSPGSKNRVEFYVDFQRNKNRVTYMDITNRKVTETLHYLFEYNVVLRKKEEDHIFNRKTLKESYHDDMQFFIESHTNKFNGQIFDSEWDFLYQNYENWTYVEGEKFGMPVYEIEGTVTEDISPELVGPFTMTISKETGALLDLKAYGSRDKPFVSLTVKEIKLNQGIPDDVFILDVSGYKELPNKEFNISGIENYQEKPGGVDTSR
ncbi:hypothetical protein [Virgibacillus doumboii]|uniref:hypothetical protein n=1 Tax=Virgibacillus doumboii TaxID=2697503 RepID=UPI0013E0BCFD|nr:hypothetical protein [Virgibacillus doumboii]